MDWLTIAQGAIWLLAVGFLLALLAELWRIP